MKKRSLLVLASVVILALGWWGHGQLTAPDDTPRASAGGGARNMMGGRQRAGELNSSAPVVQAIAAEVQTRSPALNLFGQTRFSQTWQVSSDLSARVVSIQVNSGQRVAAGDVLVTLNARELQRSREQLLSQRDELNARLRQERLQGEADLAAVILEEELLQLNQQTLSRTQGLSERNLASAADVEDARRTVINQQQSLQNRRLAVARQEDNLAQLQAQLDSLERQLAAVDEDLASARVTAPVDGLIEDIAIQVGQSVSAGTPLLTLQAVEPFQVRATLPASRIGLLDRDNPLRGNMLWQGQQTGLTLHNWGVSTTEGGVAVTFNLDDPAEPLIAGSFAAMTVLLPPQEGVTSLPASALYGNNRVYRVHDDRLEGFAATIVGQDPERAGEGYLVRVPDLPADSAILTTRLERPETGLRVQQLRPGTRNEESIELRTDSQSTPHDTGSAL